MSDIFISYKREERPVARKQADALEKKAGRFGGIPSSGRVNTVEGASVDRDGLSDATCR